MSDAIDTSAEAVERLASRVNTVADWRCYGIAATLRALLVERDTWQQMAMGEAHRLMLAETERDAALVERDTARRNEQIARGWKHQAQAQAAEEICARNEAENKLEAAQAEAARLRALLAGVLDNAALRRQYAYLDRGIGVSTPEGKRLLEARVALGKEAGDV